MPEPKEVYDIADLRDWKSATSGLAKPARLAVIGDPVAHSRSPQMHQPALDAAGIECSYVRIHLKPDEIEEALTLFRENDFIGINVTIPHKGTVAALVSEQTEVARRTGSVNTVVFDAEGPVGHNTDAPGWKRAVREEFSIDLSDLRILILGAGGGAGKAAAVQCALDRCERLVLANRTIEKAQALVADLRPSIIDPDKLEGPASRLVAVPWSEDALEDQLENIDLIVNATSLGMKRSDGEVVPARLLQPHHLVYDMIYSPPRTRLIADAEAAGARAVNGIGMLLWQGVLAFEFWFDRQAPVGEMRNGLMRGMG